MPILLLNPKFIDKINYLKNQLFWHHATTRLEDIYDLHGSFSDPQEFYLIKKKPMVHDNYPNIMLTEESNGFFKISEFNVTSNKIFNLTSIPSISDNHGLTTKIPTIQELSESIISTINLYTPIPGKSYKIQGLATISQSLKKIKKDLHEGYDDIIIPVFVRNKVFDQFTQHLQENPNPEIAKSGSPYFDQEQFKNWEIYGIYSSAKEYIDKLYIPSQCKDKIKKEFDDLNKKICDDASQKLDKKSILKNLSLAVENFNPIIEQQREQQDYTTAYQRNASEIHTPKPAPTTYQSVWQNLQQTSQEKKGNISKRGTKVILSKDEIENYFNQNKDSLQLLDSRKIEQKHVANLVKKREEDIETLYFSFIGKALEDTRQINPNFSFQDALLALKIAKYFGGVTNKLNDRGDGYENLELQEVNDFLNELQSLPKNSKPWASALMRNSIDEKKFNQLKKFSALYQKHAGQYFKSARDSKTNIRLTFFPDRFMNKLISHDGKEIVNKARVTTSRTYV